MNVKDGQAWLSIEEVPDLQLIQMAPQLDGCESGAGNGIATELARRLNAMHCALVAETDLAVVEGILGMYNRLVRRLP